MDFQDAAGGGAPAGAGEMTGGLFLPTETVDLGDAQPGDEVTLTLRVRVGAPDEEAGGREVEILSADVSGRNTAPAEQSRGTSVMGPGGPGRGRLPGGGGMPGMPV